LLRGQLELVRLAHHVAATGADLGDAGVFRSAALACPFQVDRADCSFGIRDPSLSG
jgi:hypothetical protein